MKRIFVNHKDLRIVQPPFKFTIVQPKIYIDIEGVVRTGTLVDPTSPVQRIGYGGLYNTPEEFAAFVFTTVLYSNPKKYEVIFTDIFSTHYIQKIEAFK